MSRVIVRLALAALCCFGSCQPSIRGPESPGRGSPVAMGREPGAGEPEAPSGPVQVLFHTPEGDTDGNVEISAMFDRPMVAMDRADAVQPSVVRIAPATDAEVRWLGTRTATLVPRAPLPNATEYTLTIPAGTRALDGTQTAEQVTWKFRTPPPRVARSDPYDGAHWQLPNREVDLYFNQRVTPESVQRSSLFRVEPAEGDPVEIPTRVARPDPRDDRRVRVQPTRTLGIGASVTLVVDAGFVGAEGPLSMGAEWTTSFETYGRFDLDSTDPCEWTKVPDGCNPDGSAYLRFTNPVKMRDARRAISVSPSLTTPDHGDDETSPGFHLGGQLRPRTTYRVTIRPDLVDTFGQRYRGPRTFTFTVGSYRPSASLALDGRILEASASGRVAARVANVRQARLLLKHVSPSDLYSTVESVGWGSEMTPKLAGQAGVIDRTLTLGVGPAERRTVPLDIRPGLTNGKGLVVVEFGSNESASEYYRYRRAIVAVTNLSQTVKVSPRGGLVWVTRLDDGRPVPGARVTIFRRGGTRVDGGVTDSSGIVQIPADRLWGDRSPDQYEAQDTLFVATTGDDATYVRGFEGGVDPWELGVSSAWEQPGDDLEGHLFFERGIYRPGDRLRVKGVVREWSDSGLGMVRGEIAVNVTDSQGNEIDAEGLQLSEFGTFLREVRIPANAPLGPVTVTAEIRGRSFTASASVEEFRPAELEVKVEPSARTYVRGETMRFGVEGSYLFGAPMGGSRATWTATRAPAPISIPDHDAFSFGNGASWLEEETESASGLLGEGQGDLDARGELAGEVSLALERLDEPAQVTVEATVRGLGGDELAGRAGALLLPGEFLVGVKPDTTFLAAGETLDAKLVAVDLEGHRVEGVRLRGELVRNEWRSVRRAAEAGSYDFVNTRTESAAGSCAVTSGREPAACRIRVARPGLHILRVTGTDRRGNDVRSQLLVWASGPGSYGWALERGPKLELRTARTSYRIGQTARILIPSPFAEAEALITVERAGIISREWRHVVGNTPTIDIPITDRFVPNAFVSVALVRGRTAPPGAADDPGRPDYKVGAIELRADPSERHLSVTVRPDAADKRPGEEVQVGLEVKDGAGRPVLGEVAFYAVDEGVLSLTGYRTPDPFQTIYAARGLSVRTADARSAIMTPVPPEEGDKGGDAGGGGGEGTALRNRFEAVAYYDGAVRTGADGRASVRFRLPDNLTRFRLMAVAVSRGAEMGSGEAAVTTSKPLLLRAMLPRFLRAGDTMSAGVVVHSKGAGSGNAVVSLEAEGITVSGPTTKQVELDEGGGAEVRFDFRAGAAGRAKLRFRARLGRWQDGLEVTRQVKIPTHLETVTAYGDTEGRIAEALAPAQGVRRDVGGLEVTLASSALVGLEDPIRELVDYPYECSEQLTSKLIPLVSFEELAGAYGLERGPDLEARIDRTIALLEQKQRDDGSFGLWEGFFRFPPLDAFLTAYAGFGLHAAKSRGHAVGEDTLTRAVAFLKGYLRTEPSEPEWRRLSKANKAFVVYALAAMGSPQPSYHGFLFEHRDELPLWAKVMLAHAIVVAQGDRAQVRILVREVANGTRQTAAEAHLEENLSDGYDSIMHSEARATAMWLRLLLATEPRHPLVPKLVRWLVGVRRPNGAWTNTQETTWALLAMSDYFRALEAEPPRFHASVRMAGSDMLGARFEGRSLRVERGRIDANRLPSTTAPIELSREGVGRLFYAIRFQYARATMPTAPLDRGFFVERRFERIEPSTLTSARALGTATRAFTAGDLVRVTLHVVVPQRRNFVVVDDPVPAGFEIVNFDLATSAQGWRSAGSGYAADEPDQDHDYDDDYGDVDPTYQPFYHRENRDDRVVLAANDLEPGNYRYEYVARAVTPGRYLVPPTHAEEMYTPETFGRTEATTITVRER
ncbi:MAG: Ig-like domain-containing protein [Deltaproteobacteria bacterium]|nr:Ig-like domain-containing protein [Deltaproteobacteria bacterium]